MGKQIVLDESEKTIHINKVHDNYLVCVKLNGQIYGFVYIVYEDYENKSYKIVWGMSRCTASEPSLEILMRKNPQYTFHVI